MTDHRLYALMRLGAIIWLLAGLLNACADQRLADPVDMSATASVPTAPLAVGLVDDTLQMIFPVAPASLNPYISPALSDWYASRIIYEPLASFDRDGNLVPFLAAEIPSRENGAVAADGMSVTWKLRQDVQWSDGVPFTASDVKFTVEYITNPAVASHAAVAYDLVEQVEILDEYTVRVRFTDPNPAWAVPLVGRYGLILPQHLFEAYTGDKYREAPANDMPVGTGPYTLVSFSPQEVLFLEDRLVATNRIVYEPNPGFRAADTLSFGQIEVMGWGMPDLSASAVLENGTADYVPNLQVGDVLLQSMQSDGQGVADINFGSRLLLLELNTSDPNQGGGVLPHPIFDDLRVRQAVSLAIDREEIVSAIFGDTARLTSNVLLAPDAYASPNTTVTFDPARARALLDQAGWRDTDADGVRDRSGAPLRVVYQYLNDPLAVLVMQSIQQNLEAVGFAVETTAVPTDNLMPADQPAFDMRQAVLASASPDALLFLQRWTCDQIPQAAQNQHGQNVIHWCHATYEDLYTQARTELDAEARRELFIRMNDLLVDDGFVLPVAHLADVSGVSNNLQGREWTPWDADVWQIKDWRR